MPLIRAQTHPLFRPWVVGALAGLFLVVCRWSLIWLPHEMHPDESQMIAGAITLLHHDPLFWRSVDGGTAGPLDFYALLPAAFFFGTTTYGVARLIGTLFVWGILIAAGETIFLLTRRGAARIAILPALVYEACTTSHEFVHYSTELLPSLLLALAVWLVVRQSLRPSRGNLWGAALLLGAVPFGKLQVAPIAAALGLFLVCLEIKAGRAKNVALLAIVGSLPTFAVASVYTATGQTDQVLIPYFFQNLLYAHAGRLPVSQVIIQLGQQSVTDGYDALWLIGSVFFCLTVPLLARKNALPLGRYAGAATGLLIISVGCILSPGRPYHHYLNLLTLPVTLLTGIALGKILAPLEGALKTRLRPIVVFLGCTLLPQIALLAAHRPDPYEYYHTEISPRNPGQAQLVALLKRLASPGEPLGLWGWRSSLYVETGAIQATRSANTISQLVVGPWQKYFLRTYFSDLSASFPPVFVDTAGPGNFQINTRTQGHEKFPLLRDWVAKNYQFVREIDGVRVYERRDRWSGTKIESRTDQAQMP